MLCARILSFGLPGRVSETRVAIGIDVFSDLLRRNGLFAVSEIGKAFVIVGYGDFATADVVGEFIAIVLPSATLRFRGPMPRS